MLSSLAIISATLLGPVFAVQVQKYLERGREESERRNRICKILCPRVPHGSRPLTLRH
jgi:hypothetical protein